MKQLLMALVAAAFLVSVGVAQDQDKTEKKDKAATAQSCSESKKDCSMDCCQMKKKGMKAGKMSQKPAEKKGMKSDSKQ